MICRAKLSKTQRSVLDLIMHGWTVQDIAEEYEKAWTTIQTHLNRAVAAIVKCNNDRWYDFFEQKEVVI